MTVDPTFNPPTPTPRAPVAATGADLWSQRVGALRDLRDLLVEYRVDPGTVLEAIGLNAADVSDADQRIPYRAAAKLFAECYRQTRVEHIGLVAGRAWRLTDLGPLGELVLNSATAGEALGTLVAYHQLNAQGGAAYLVQRARTVELGYALFHPGVDEAAVVADAVLAMGAGFVRELCGAHWRPIAVHLPRKEPADMHPYRALFRCPVHFNAERAVLVFEPAVMACPVVGADQGRRQAVEAQVQRLLDSAFVPSVYRAVRMQLMQGWAAGDVIAQQLHLQRRTFNRRLAQSGLTYQGVLDEVRYGVSRQLLRDTELAVIDVAAALGYGDSGNFSRAFNRWSGQSPTAWRQANRVPQS